MSIMPAEFMKSCLVIEDDFSFFISAHKVLRSLGFGIIDNATSLKATKELLTYKDYDLLLCDIFLEDGQMTIDIIHEYLENSKLIFTTASQDDNIYQEVQKTNHQLYLVKPIDALTLRSAIDFLKLQASAKKQHEQNHVLRNGKILINDGSAFLNIEIEKILYIKSEGNYCTFFNEDQKFTTRNRIGFFAKLLHPHGIIQIHRGYLINFKKIITAKFSKNIVVIGGAEIPIGRKYKPAFREIFEASKKEAR